MPRTPLFSPKLNTSKLDMKEREIISHNTRTRTRDLAIREQCSNQLSYSMNLIHSDGKLSVFNQSISGLHHTGNSHQPRGPSAIRLISWGAHQTMSTASKHKLQFPIWTSQRIFKVQGNLKPHATYSSFLSKTQHLQARYESKKKIISHTTGTQTRDLAIREQCSNLLSYRMILIHSDGNLSVFDHINIWRESYWQLAPIKRALGHSLDIMGSVSNYVHCEQMQIAISNSDVKENFQSARKFEATCHVLLFSLRNSTLASQI